VNGRALPSAVADGEFTLLGRKVRFDKTLSYSVEELDCTAPETEPIPEKWGVKSLYRISLTSTAPFLKHNFVLTVE
jgi:hypothetical protein